jgi:FtsZ-binding cell division protein ZapB
MENKETISSKDKRNNLIVIILSVALVVLAGLFFWQRSSYKTDAEFIRAEKDSIATELSKMATSYNTIRSENDSLNTTIGFAQTKVKDLLTEVEQVKNVSYQQITKYRQEVTTLRNIMRDYIIQIDSLNQKNQRLMAENSDVKQQVTEAKSANQQLEEQKKKLEQTVTLAAQLEATDLRATGITAKGKEQVKAAKIEKVKIDFILSKNQTAKRGTKNIYVRIQRPDQILLMKSDKDVFKFEDMKIPFSSMREVEYEGSDIPVSIYWDNAGESSLMPGKYTVDVFADERNIGTTTFEVK